MAHRDLAQERIKQLQKQLDETVRAVSNIEDLNSILRAKNQRLEKDFWDLEDKDNNLRNDVCVLRAQLSCFTEQTISYICLFICSTTK